MLKKPLTLLAALVLGAACAVPAGRAFAQDEQPAADQDQPEQKSEGQAEEAEPAATASDRVTNLDNPCGVAVHPKTGHVFITSRYGIYRYLPDETDRSKKINIEVLAEKIDQYGMGPIYQIGPLGLAFLDDGRLVVGGGGLPDGQELVRVYKIGDAAPEKPIEEGAAEQTLGPIPPSEETTMGEGNFYAVAIGAGHAYFTSNGDDTKGWVLRCELQDGKLGELKLWLATKPKVEVDAPVGITFSPDGSELVVGQMGEVNIPGDSLLTTYDPASGELKKRYETDLSDIAGLAYSPKTGKLYAVDFAWAEPEKGGLFRLDIEGDEVKSTKILGLDKPTSLAFDKEGRLWVAVFGTKAEDDDSDKSPGKLLLIEGDL